MRDHKFVFIIDGHPVAGVRVPTFFEGLSSLFVRVLSLFLTFGSKSTSIFPLSHDLI